MKKQLRSLSVLIDRLIGMDYVHSKNHSVCRIMDQLQQKRVKYVRQMLFVLCLLTSQWANAYDFKVNGVYYRISGSDVYVTYQNLGYDGYSSRPNGVKYMYPSWNDDGFYCWSDYSGEIVIPSTVTYRGTTYNVVGVQECAFANSLELESVTLPNSIKKLGEYAFYNCNKLEYVYLPDGITTIDEETFGYCTSLNSINIPSSVEHIEEYCGFSDCTSLPITDGIQYADTYLVKAMDKTKTTYNIKKGTRFIGERAFQECNKMESITLPESLISIGNDAFDQCFLLNSLTLPDNLVSIGDHAIARCQKLKKIVVPNTVKTIGYGAFRYCESLEELHIPAGVSIGNLAFEGCTGKLFLDSSIYSYDEDGYDRRYYYSPFGELESWGPSDDYASNSNAKFTEIILGEHVGTIDNHVFNFLPNLKKITCKSLTPPTLGWHNSISAAIYVPEESMELYQDTWKGLGTFYPVYPDPLNVDEYRATVASLDKLNTTYVVLRGGLQSDVTENILKEGMNPNCLYFIRHASLQGDNIINLDDNSASKISLTDGYPYDCPIPFHAKTVEYKHTPSVWANGKSGWETLTLPFEATEFEASKSGYIAPILLGSSGDFWLRKYVNSNNSNVFFSSLMEPVMESNTPYIIAFPGETMGNGHLQGQTITFRGVDVDIEVTEVPRQQKNQYTFVGNYDTVIDGITGYELNTTGNAFVQSAEVGKEPFHAYFMTKDASNNVKSLGISFGQYNDETGIFEVEDDGADTNIRQGSYDLSGRKTEAKSKGIYIVNGKKVVKL